MDTAGCKYREAGKVKLDMSKNQTASGAHV